MTTRVQSSTMVNVPVSVAYNQWTQFEEFPQFMGGVDQRDPAQRRPAGVGRRDRRRPPEWEAQDPRAGARPKVAWAATEGATNAGSVEFEDVGGGQTSVQLFLEYEPEGLVEKVGDKLNVVEKQAEGDLERFKAFIESEGYATGAWRGRSTQGGNVGTPGVDSADASRGDSGKAGVSGKAAAGVAAAAVAGAAAVAATRAGSTKGSEGGDDGSGGEAGATEYAGEHTTEPVDEIYVASDERENELGPR